MGRPRFDIFPNVTEKLISCLFYGALLWFCGPVIKLAEEISKTLILVLNSEFATTAKLQNCGKLQGKASK